MSETQKYLHVSDIVLLETRGPWHSKSGGELIVLTALNAEQVAKFQDYSNPEFNQVLARTGIDIRGLRIYTVSGIPGGSTGANEYHLARTEIISVLSGKVMWKLEDVYGNVKEISLDTTQYLIVPPGILHTYTGLEHNTRLQVVCNTLFDPENPGTHDSYSIEEFRQLQATIKFQAV